jgi:hypothetical protein
MGFDGTRRLLDRLAAIIGASEEDLRNLPFPHPLQLNQHVPAPDHMSNYLHPFLAVLDDWSAALMVQIVDMKSGRATMIANERWVECFCSLEDLLRQVSTNQAFVIFLILRCVLRSLPLLGKPQTLTGYACARNL